MALVLDGDNGIVGVLATNTDGDVIFDTDTLFVDAPNNSVGIGTLTPTRKLHVNGSGRFDMATGTVRISEQQSMVSVQGVNNAETGFADLKIDGSNVILNVQSGGNVGIGDTDPAEKFTIKGDGARMTISSNDYEVAMLGRRGSTAPNWDRGYLRMKYDGANTVVLDTGGVSYLNGGNVGIGTSDPTKKLDIRGGDVTIYGGVDGFDADQERVRLYMGNNNAHIGAMYNYGLFFNPGNSAGDAMMIRQSSGNVIIGDINTEGYKLEVVSDNAANNLMVHKKNAVGPGLATNIAMQVTQTNGQSARLAEIGADFESGWGGSLHFATKNDNGSPNNSTTERMRIDYDGRVTMPYQPSFCAGVGTNYTLVNFAQKINHSHAFSNIGGHYNTTNSKFTAPVAGNYFFWHRMNFGNGGTGNVEAKIYINGVERFRDYEYAGGSGQYNNSLSLGTYYMNAGDYAEPWSHVNNSPQPTLVGSTTIQISTFGGWLNT